MISTRDLVDSWPVEVPCNVPLYVELKLRSSTFVENDTGAVEEVSTFE